jgi:toxin ParE1/3/4
LKLRITIRPQADRDLVDQAEYLARNASLAVALRFYAAAEETFSLLAAHPEMGRTWKSPDPSLSGIRMYLLRGFPKCLVFYRATRGGIEIVRVLHGARDVDALLGIS